MSSTGAQGKMIGIIPRSQASALLQSLPKTGLIDSTGHGEMARVLEEMVSWQESQDHQDSERQRHSGPRQHLKWSQDGRKYRTKREDVSPAMAKDSSPWTHANGITLVKQLPQKYPVSSWISLLLRSFFYDPRL